MARTEIVEFKVDADEKAILKGHAVDREEPLGTYVRKAALAFPEYDKGPIPHETQRDVETKASTSEQELRAKAMELVRTKGLSFRAALAQVKRDG